MRVFVGGATGYIGTAIAKSLRSRGHTVLGAARNAEAAARLRAAGVTPVDADLGDAASFGRAAREAEAVIQTASTSDARSSDLEPRAATAILEALAGTTKPFVLTSGVWVYGDTGDAAKTEDSPLDPLPLVAWRLPVEKDVLQAPSIRGAVIRPGIVYGGGAGIPAMFVASARRDQKVAIPGDGKNRWPVVHVDDLGELYALVLEKGAPGAIYNGSTEEIPTSGEVGRAIAERHGAAFATWPLEEARKAMGLFADALALDQIIRSPRSNALGWAPKGPSLADEIARGSYG
jgi:nucleoside-diphosphate-sugar epimerase